MKPRRCWKGTVIGGPMKGNRIEIRGQGFPVELFLIQYTQPEKPQSAIIGYAVGRDGLQTYFEEFFLTVDWNQGRSPLVPDPPRRRTYRRHRDYVRGARRRRPNQAGEVGVPADPEQPS